MPQQLACALRLQHLFEELSGFALGPQLPVTLAAQHSDDELARSVELKRHTVRLAAIGYGFAINRNEARFEIALNAMGHPLDRAAGSSSVIVAPDEPFPADTERLLRWVQPAQMGEALLGCLEEGFRRELAAGATKAARLVFLANHPLGTPRFSAVRPRVCLRLASC